MKRVFLLGAGLLVAFSLTACGKDNDLSATEIPVTNAPTENMVTDAPVVTEELIVTEVPVSETDTNDEQVITSATDIPLDFQKEGWISSDEAVTLLKMYLGSYDDSGNELSFGHESTIIKDGIYYYNFRITSLIISESGMAHQSYFGNYLISTDGNDISEHIIE